MNHSFMALAFQEAAPDDSSMWIILAIVLVILFFIVVIVGVGLTIFFIARKRSKAQRAPAKSAMVMATGPGSSDYSGMPRAEPPQVAPVLESSSPTPETYTPSISEPSLEAAPSPDIPAFDASRTVAIPREKKVSIGYGSIKFVSGVLAGQQFDVKPEGSYIGREGSLSQIVVPDPRISKRHLWIGVRSGLVKIVDQDSRNGTFVNDPKSERVTETTLNSGDTVILGESDVARFEYNL